MMFVLFLFSFFVSSVITRKPIILFPGLSGTAFYASLDKSNSSSPFYCSTKDTQFRIWLSLTELAQPAVNCFVDNMKLNFDPSTGFYNNTEGVTITPIDWGGVKGIDYLDYKDDGKPYAFSQYMNPLIELLEGQGYQVGKDLFGAPYDWRYSPDYFHTILYPNLFQSLIENVSHANGNEKVVLIAHSMGNAHLTYFLTQMVSSSWKSKYVDRFIMVSNPQAGAPGMVRAVLSGNNDEFSFWFFHWISEVNTRKLYSSWPSFLMMTPHEASVYGDLKIVTITNKDGSKSRTFNISQIEEVLEITGDKNLPIMYDLESEMRSITMIDPKVPIYCLYSDMGSNSTEIAYIYTDDDDKKNKKNIFDREPTKIKGHGDGSVPLASLSLCRKWKSTLDHRMVKNVTHDQTVQDKNSIEIIWEFVDM